MRHIISILIENEAGALSRVAGLFSARGYNIESLTVGPTEDASLSRITIVTIGTERIIEQIVKQVDKLIDVVSLQQLTVDAHVEREVLLVKVAVEGKLQIDDVKSLIATHKARVIDESTAVYIIELTESARNISVFLDALSAYNILETVRSGVTGIARGKVALQL